MTVTKTWSINTLERELADGYVNKAIFRVDGEDGTYKFRATGEVNLERPETLIPYADLTEETVLGWVKAKLNSEKDPDGNTVDKVANIEAAVENGVNLQKTPTHGTGVPW
tara:strand:- start:38 stop:367 length:330 start_codon:yes stop_codon:yes gene_type:complete